MEQRIIRFLRHHHVLALSTWSDEGLWTAHCFYALLPEEQALVFTSDPDTRHGHNMLQNPNVSGGIALETKIIGKIRGIQLSGRSFFCENVTDASPVSSVIPTKIGTPSLTAELGKCRNAYLKRFPFALAAKLDLWILYIDYIKMTDNLLGFGKKLEWRREVRRR